MVGRKPERKPFGRDGPPKGYPKDPEEYADAENWRYPLHTSWHAKAARRYFDDQSNRGKYHEAEQEYIDWRIDQALQKFGAKTQGPKPRRRSPPVAPKSKAADELSLDQLLRLFLGAARFQRAQEMDDALVSITQTSEDEIAGTVKQYTIRIDLKDRTITHDCQDWNKNTDSKNMCKHLGKFMLSLNEARATEVMRRVLSEIDQWTFKAPDDQSG